MFFLSVFITFFAFGIVFPMDNQVQQNRQQCVSCKVFQDEQIPEFAIEESCVSCLVFSISKLDRNALAQSKPNLLVKALEVLNKKINTAVKFQTNLLETAKLLNKDIVLFKRIASLLINVINSYELDNYCEFIKYSSCSDGIFEALDYVFERSLNIRFDNDDDGNFIHITLEEKNNFLMKAYSFLRTIASDQNNSIYKSKIMRSFIKKFDEDTQQELLEYKPKAKSRWPNQKTLLEVSDLFYDFYKEKEKVVVEKPKKSCWNSFCTIL